MSAPQTITADGMEWPLQTFIDARGFVRVDPFAPPELSQDVLRLELVTLDGEHVRERYASAVIWQDVRAFRLIDEIGDPCFCCGTSVDECVMCDDCAMECGDC